MKKIIFSLFVVFTTLFSLTFEEVKDIEKKYGDNDALPLYKKLAEQDDVEAMFELARIYLEGKVVKRNYFSAKQLLESASERNHDKSTYYLGKLYLLKKGPYYDPVKAYNTFVIAANNDYAPAQNMIGQFLLNGIAVDKDYILAVKLFEKASKQGYIEAQCNLAFMYASGKGVFPNFGRAHQFAKKGKEEGNKRCIKVWNDYNLEKYPEDKGWKFNFYTQP
ncbi:tetratricopeptide repeat protein [Halarcobacter ebronensis]|uniref:beta-lactamase n=1 Tax=Halarcobacter ebronensis TaxID=1462615 RepID=A0A4Q1AFW3_9BACT|nr:tetratricopeptide repeat protein [Halarcobacter ebronensis]QKF81469.1 Sel1 domain-containing protein [Halarcobacter ebronensis]RXK02469.1 hypothetical protein CRV07_13445 [Halarcobacter ebronensis]